MSDLLKNMSREFDARMALRRKMLAHLEIDLSEAATLANQEDVRATMIGCSCCRAHEECQLWLLWRRAGTPDACVASDPLLRLQAVSEAERAMRRRAM